jgi:transmembrane protein DUF3566
VPDGDVGSANPPTANSDADTSADVTRPNPPPTAPPTQGAVPGEPIVQGPGGNGEAVEPGGVPAAVAPARKPRAPRRRGRVIGAAGHDDATADTGSPRAGNGVAPTGGTDAAHGGGDESSASDNGAAPTARRPSMSARLGSVPDARRDDADAATPTAAPPVAGRGSTSAEPIPVLLVPEVLPPTAPTPRIVPAVPEIVPAVPDDSQPQPPPVLTDPEAAPYDLAADDPALAFEQPAARVRRRRPRVRRVTRVVRTVDTWSVFKVATLFAAVLYVSALLSGVLLWNVAYATGTIDNAERFMESFGWQTFEFKGGEIFHDAWIIGMFAAAGLVGMTVLAAATFNLVSDLVGGVRVTVLEEEMVVRPVSRRRKQRIRKAPPRAATAPPPAPDVAAEPGTELAHRPDNLPTL